ncbi:MAG: hypothetical protein ACYDAL_18075 [Candidatus Dormibacteraceae bacterium]
MGHLLTSVHFLTLMACASAVGLGVRQALWGSWAIGLPPLDPRLLRNSRLFGLAQLLVSLPFSLLAINLPYATTVQVVALLPILAFELIWLAVGYLKFGRTTELPAAVD